MKNTLNRSRSASKPRYTVVDLFCGCGGFSTGLEATGRFKTLLGIDISQTALETFAINHGSAAAPVKTIKADLGKLNPKVIRSELRSMGILTGQLDVLVGGPPCEGFSQNKAERSESHEMYDFATRASHSTKRWSIVPGITRASAPRKLRPVRSQRTDDRNELFRVMLQAAAVLRPKIILLENVREIITYNDGAIISEIEEALATNYTIAVRILNAADYGVPQMRRRAFIVAVRNDIRGETLAEAFFPLPTHIATSETVGLKTLQGDRGKHVTVWEAIGDLPLPRAVSGTRSREATLQKLTITGYRRFVGRSGSVKNHEERALSKRVLARLKAMKPGMRSHHLPKKLRTRKFFYNAYARLEWNRPANTITKSFVNLGSGKFGHPDQDRGVTIREAARLQSFPDDFQFCDASLKTLATMVGGAVPPLLAKAFGLRIAALLDEKANRKRSPSHSQRKQFSRHTAVKKIKRRRY